LRGSSCHEVRRRHQLACACPNIIVYSMIKLNLCVIIYCIIECIGAIDRLRCRWGTDIKVNLDDLPMG
jgi:hypothetical protein